MYKRQIYDKLVKNRTKQAKELGYENYVELGYYRMNRNCYTREQVEAFRDQVKKDFVPFVEKLHDRRRQRLGLDKLSFIDEGVYFKEGNPNPVGTPEEILEAGQRMYGQQMCIRDRIKYAVIVVSSAPIMCMYPFVQKYFNQGVMLGSLKG